MIAYKWTRHYWFWKLTVLVAPVLQILTASITRYIYIYLRYWYTTSNLGHFMTSGGGWKNIPIYDLDHILGREGNRSMLCTWTMTSDHSSWAQSLHDYRIACDFMQYFRKWSRDLWQLATADGHCNTVATCNWTSSRHVDLDTIMLDDFWMIMDPDDLCLVEPEAA
jgi:hypothetical protein